jgi:hypothetical protein
LNYPSLKSRDSRIPIVSFCTRIPTKCIISFSYRAILKFITLRIFSVPTVLGKPGCVSHMNYYYIFKILQTYSTVEILHMQTSTDVSYRANKFFMSPSYFFRECITRQSAGTDGIVEYCHRKTSVGETIWAIGPIVS